LRGRRRVGEGEEAEREREIEGELNREGVEV